MKSKNPTVCKKINKVREDCPVWRVNSSRSAGSQLHPGRGCAGRGVDKVARWVIPPGGGSQALGASGQPGDLGENTVAEAPAAVSRALGVLSQLWPGWASPVSSSSPCSLLLGALHTFFPLLEHLSTCLLPGSG